jgi:hypothetical protein
MFFSSKNSGFINLNMIWRQNKNFKAISSPPPIFADSNYTTSSQTQTGATLTFS